MKIYHQGQMVRSLLRHVGAGDAGLGNSNVAAAKGLVQRTQGQPGGKRPESRWWTGYMAESVMGHRTAGQGIAPVVIVADQQLGQFLRFFEGMMCEQMIDLPMPLTFC